MQRVTADDGVAAVVEIWDDPDVEEILSLNKDTREVLGEAPSPKFWDFNDKPEQLALVRSFLEADQKAGSDGPKSAFVDACLAGIRATEGLPASVEIGWSKFFTFQVYQNTVFLWRLHRANREVAAVAHWLVDTIQSRGWGPNGNTTALGQAHSDSMALAAEAGGGMRMDPATGGFEYPDGSEARAAAAQGGFTVAAAPSTRPAPPPEKKRGWFRR